MTWRRCAENPRSGARHLLDDHGESQEKHTQAQPECSCRPQRHAAAAPPYAARGSGTRRAAAGSARPRSAAAPRVAAHPVRGTDPLAGPAPAVLETGAAGSDPGVRGTRGGGPDGRLRAPSGRDHAVPGASAPAGVRQRRDLLGVLLRRALLAGAGRRGRGAQAVRHCRTRRAVLVRSRGEAAVLRALAGRPGRHVLLCAPPLRRDRGARGIVSPAPSGTSWPASHTSR